MGVPYIMAVRDDPSTRYGVYMGIINMMIVVPMLIHSVTFGWVYSNILGDLPEQRDHGSPASASPVPPSRCCGSRNRRSSGTSTTSCHAGGGH